MKKNHFYIIGTECKWEEKEILKAVRRKGFSGKILGARGMDIRLSAGGAQLYYAGKNITETFKKSRIFFRRTRGAQEKMITLAILAKGWGLRFTDSVKSIVSNLNKAIFLPSVITKKINNIETVFAGRGATLESLNTAFPYPVLIKPVCGRHGEGIKIIKNEDGLARFLAVNNKDVMIQAFLKIDAEYRIFVVGGKALGVVQKIPKKGSHIANYAAGARFIKCKIPSFAVREAISICRGQKIDIGGVDLAKVGNRFYLLEVNRCPEFYAFSGATGINVAERIVEFLLNKA
jgi:glutathione synthase/RimK-type ligase-like ATP-grasp enzyme